MARILLQLPRCVETNDYYQWETPVILAIKVGGPIFCFYEPWILTWVKKGEGIKNELFDSLAWVYSWCSSKTKTRLAIRYKILFPVSLTQRGGEGGQPVILCRTRPFYQCPCHNTTSPHMMNNSHLACPVPDPANDSTDKTYSNFG